MAPWARTLLVALPNMTTEKSSTSPLTTTTSAASDEPFGPSTGPSKPSIFDPHCGTELVVDMSVFGQVLGWSLFVISALSIVPSLTKPAKFKSTAGVSAATLVLTNAQQTTQIANIVILKSEQIALCAGNVIRCQPSMIQLYSATAAWILLFLQYQCKVWYPEPPSEDGRSSRYDRCMYAFESNARLLWLIQLVSAAFLIGVCIFWSSSIRCSESGALRYFAMVNGIVSSLLMMVRFLPQFIESCRYRSAGAISYVTYSVIGVGGFLQTFFAVFFSKEDVSTVLPVFVGNVFQTLILVTCLYFDAMKPAVERISLTRSVSGLFDPHSAVSGHEDSELAGPTRTRSETELSNRSFSSSFRAGRKRSDADQLPSRSAD